jgi:hypothetical protein
VEWRNEMFEFYAVLLAIVYVPSLLIANFYGHKRGYSEGMEIKLVKLLEKRAYIFNCSYKTAWDRYISEIEKEGFTFDEINNLM